MDSALRVSDRRLTAAVVIALLLMSVVAPAWIEGDVHAAVAPRSAAALFHSHSGLTIRQVSASCWGASSAIAPTGDAGEVPDEHAVPAAEVASVPRVRVHHARPAARPSPLNPGGQSRPLRI